MSHNPSDDPVDAAKLRAAKAIIDEVGAPWPRVDHQPATIPHRDDDKEETEEEFQARTAPPAGGYRIVPPKMTLKEAQAKLKTKAKVTGAASSSSSSSSATPAPVDPQWRTQVLQTLLMQGLEPAPADYPADAAFHIVPDLGIGFVLTSDQQPQSES